MKGLKKCDFFPQSHHDWARSINASLPQCYRHILKSADNGIQFHMVRTADLGICALVNISDKLGKNVYFLLSFI